MRFPYLLSALALGLAACSHPGSWSGDRSADLQIPARYDGTSAPVPEVSGPLLARFDDPALRRIVKRALRNNPDLKSSAARLQEAGYQLSVTRAPLLPVLNGNASATRRQFANLGFGGPNATIPPNNSFDLSLDVSWEPDIWGRIRAGVSASQADLQAAGADFASARQSVAAQTMQAYMELAGAEQRLGVSRRRLASFESTLELVERRFEAGTAELSELDLSRTDVANTRAELARREDARDQAARNLRLLTGDYPDADLRVARLPALKAGIPAGLPSRLLMRRPDVDAAYQRLRAADERITVAHRALFPSFNLTATGGRSAPTLADLSSSNFKTWNILAGLSAPLFQGGRLRAELGAASKRAEQAYYNYQRTVLNAFREVEDALGSERALARQEEATRDALEAATSAEQRTRRNYEAGLVEILTLLDTQRRRFAAEDALIDLQVLRRQNRVALALALAKGI